MPLQIPVHLRLTPASARQSLQLGNPAALSEQLSSADGTDSQQDDSPLGVGDEYGEEEEDDEVEGAEDESSLALLLAYERLQVGCRNAIRSRTNPVVVCERAQLSPHDTMAACLCS